MSYSHAITVSKVSSSESDQFETLAQSALSKIITAKTILIGTHLNPDGDAFGSALALSHTLKQMGKYVEVICHHSAPRNLEFLPGVDEITKMPTKLDFDLGIILDLDSVDRLGSTAPYFEKIPCTIVIDHHIPQEAPGDIRIIDTTAPATAVILTRLLLAWKANFTPSIATCLYTGIVTDTGSFRFRNTTPEALALASLLLDHGANLEKVSEEIFLSRPLASTRLLGLVLNRMVLEADNRLVYSIIRFDDFELLKAKDEDTEGFVNELLSVDTVQIAAIGRETKPNVLRVSLRSRSHWDVAEIAREFGGGGHRNAAGLTFEGDVNESMGILVNRIKQCLASF